ncbi:hypothetical protein FRC06_000777 [Ceratobasidium sp. 370]|nr:hypothetical protein FRC06_000777 [Ceratobasidium sp. 370]
MARFHVYAPFIKSLSFDQGVDSVEVPNWEPLVSYSQGSELLPNLVQFTCRKLDFRALDVFLSGSTRIVRIYGPLTEPQLLDAPATSQLLEHLGHKCPNIHKLEFYSKSDELAELQGAQDNLAQTFALLPHFRDLRNLTSTPAIIQPPVLPLLAQMPNLVDLCICVKGNTLPWDSSLRERLPADSFPELKKLALSLETSRDVKRFWELIPLASLNEVYITMRSEAGNESQFIPTLCQASPQIRGLRLTFPRRLDPGEEDGPIHQIDISMFERLARLPLDMIFSIGNAKFNFDDAWAKIAQAWPGLRDICCLRQPACLSDLTLLSSALPNLYRLECDLDLNHAVRTVRPEWQPVEQPHFYPKLIDLIIRQFELRELALSYDYDLSDLARVFAYLWPNVRVQSIQQFSSGELEEDLERIERDDWKYKQALFDMFNKLIRSHVRSFY